MSPRQRVKVGTEGPAVLRWGFVALIAGCAPLTATSGPAGEIQAPGPASTTAVDSADVTPPAAAVVADPVDTRSWSELTLDGLSLEEKVAQMMMPFVLGDYAPEGSASHDRINRWVEGAGVGGVIMSVGSPIGVAAKLNDLQRHAKIPLLVAADLETGAGFRLRGAVHLPANVDLGGATDFPSLMAVGATGEVRFAYEMGRITGIEARAVGIHVPFAPVLDVNNNPENPIINVRSFGEDPNAVAAMGRAFVEGAQSQGVIATGKHFPGHGDTGVDSHLELPIIRVDRDRLDAVELVPFRAAIDAGMGGVMTAHISVPSLTDGNVVPATLAPAVLNGLLRGEMNFDGLIFTDAMDMFAIDRLVGREEAAIRAVEAGSDVILMPPNPQTAIDAIVGAVESGRLSEHRIDESVRRILDVKSRMGLDRARTVSLEHITEVVGIPEHQEIAQTLADRSITLLRNGRGLLPLLGTRSANVMSVTYRRRNNLLGGRYFNRVLRDVYPRLRTETVGGDSDAGDYATLLRRASRSALVVVSTYVTAISYSGNVAVSEEFVDFIQELGRRRIPHIVVSFGNPYLLSEFPDAQAYMLAWSGAEVSQRAAARALFGRIEIRGTTPARLPPFFDIGDGLRIPRKEGAAGR